MRQIVLDTETTGIHPEEGHRIIEIGCVEMIDRKLTGQHFHYYLNPEREIDAGAMAVHGITNAFLQDKPVFKTIAQAFLDFVSGAELIIHNAAFDVGFINHEFALLNQGLQPITAYCQIIDTLLLARQRHAGQRNSLDALCKRYGIDNSKRDLHGALLDAHLLAQVYLAMTGGQGSFFDLLNDTPVVTQQHSQTSKTAALSPSRLVVLKANEEELVEHQKYLEQMRQRGQCLWDEG